MQLKALYLLATAAIAVAAAAVAPASEGDLDILPTLTGRSCSANGCTCLKGIKAGVYCGSCSIRVGNQQEWAVQKKNDVHSVYECGSSGSCCDYGKANDCGTRTGRCAQGTSLPY